MLHDTFVLKGNFLFTPTPDQLALHPDSYLLCKEGRTAGLFPQLPEAYRDLPLHDHGDKLILPGLVDLHVHASQYAFRGMGMDLELLDWLESNTFPEEGKFADPVYAQAAYEIFVRDLTRSATTRACVFATARPPWC